VSQINQLIENYKRFILLPWTKNLAGIQRVLFAVYPPPEERRMRASITEFEIATREAEKKWQLIDITHAPARWLGKHDYREAYFADPEALSTVEEEFKMKIISDLRESCQAKDIDEQTVLAVLGAGSLFGFTYVSGIVAGLESHIKGRLLIFFPGEYERSLYRFMDARDGFNYMAVPITCTKRMAI